MRHTGDSSVTSATGPVDTGEHGLYVWAGGFLILNPRIGRGDGSVLDTAGPPARAGSTPAACSCRTAEQGLWFL